MYNCLSVARGDRRISWGDRLGSSAMGERKPIGIGIIGTGGWARAFWAEAQKRAGREVGGVLESHAGAGGEVRGTLRRRSGLFRGGTDRAGRTCRPSRISGRTTFTASRPCWRRRPASTCLWTNRLRTPSRNRRKMIRACDTAGVTLMVGHSTRYQGVNRLLKKVLDSGRGGAGGDGGSQHLPLRRNSIERCAVALVLGRSAGRAR